MNDLYSNYVILDFAAPITRAQLDGIEAMVKIAGTNLPPLRQRPTCGIRPSGRDLDIYPGDCVVPTIAADED